MMDGISIIHEPTGSEPFLVIKKDGGLPSAPINDSDDSALSRAIELFPELESVSGKKSCEHGLVHRIDTVTPGLLLIASTQDFYDWIISLQSQGKFVKSYRAECGMLSPLDEKDGSFPPLPFVHDRLLGGETVSVRSKFRYFGKDRKLVRPVTSESSPMAVKKAEKYEYATELRMTEHDDERYIFEAKIARGFKHQVRCHLRWCGFPILGYADYNAGAEGNIRFLASGFSFYMQDGREERFSLT